MKKGWVVFLIIIVLFIGLMGIEKFKFGKVGGEGNYPPSVDFERSVEEVLDKLLPNKIYDVYWKKLFPYQTFFESLDGFTNSGVAIADAQLTFTTGASENDFARLLKQPDNHGFITFSQPSRFKTAFELAQVTNQTAYFFRGGDPSASNQGYGFKVVDGTLYGVTIDSGGTENAVSLQSVSADTEYEVEARYSPSDKVIFYVGSSAGSIVQEKGTSTTNLPSPSEVVNDLLFSVRIATNEDAAKVMYISYVQILQFRDVLK